LPGRFPSSESAYQDKFLGFKNEPGMFAGLADSSKIQKPFVIMVLYSQAGDRGW